MSRTFDALRKAERHVNGTAPRATEGPRPPAIAWSGDDARIEYERLRVWITSPPPLDDQVLIPIQTVLVVGCQAGSGATTVAARLAATLATLRSSQVLLIDANLRRPRLDHLFGLPATPGLRQALSGNGTGGREQATAYPNLFVLTAGHAARDAVEALDGPTVERLLAQLRPRFQRIVLDTAPLLDFPDAYELVRNVDAVVLVVEAERTPIDVARRVVQELRHVGVRRVGVVLNRQREYVPRVLRRFFGQPS